MKKKKNDKEPNSISKYIIIIALILFVILVGIALLVGKKSAKDINTQVQYALEDNRMVAVSKNGKYGFIDTKGNAITKINYDYILDYSGKYAIVNKGRQNIVIDQKGKEKFSTKGDIRYDETTDFYVIDGRLYNSNLNAISNKSDTVTSSGNGYFRYKSGDKKKGGVINRKGKIVYTQELEENEDLKIYIAETSEVNEHVYCAITRDNKTFAIINCDTGKVVIDYSEQPVYAQGNNIFEIADEEKGTGKAVYIKEDKVALSSKDPANMRFIEAGFIRYIDDKTNSTKFYDVKTGKIYNEEPVEVSLSYRSDFEKKTNITRIYGNNKYGLINDKKVLIDCIYDNIYFLPYDLHEYLSKQGKDYIIAKLDEKTYLVDIKTGKRVKSFDTKERINSLVNSTFIYYNEDNKVHVYNLLTEKENTYDDAVIEIYGNYIKINKENTVTYYDRDLNQFYSVTEVEDQEANTPEETEETDEE